MTTSTIHIIKAMIFILALFPFFLDIFVLIRILKYRKCAANINKNPNDFFRAIKLRYTNSSKLDIPIRSTKCFIEKCLLGKEGMLKYLYIIDKFCLFIVSFNLAATTLFLINGYMNFTYIITIISLSFYLFRQGCSFESHYYFISSMLEDYLDNTLFHRVKPSKEQPIKTTPSIKTQQKNELEVKPILHTNTNTTSTIPAASNHIIESILHEFLN